MANRLLSALVRLLLAGDALAGSLTGAETQLDVALVIAVDVSSSMEGEEQGLQREGFIEAFRSSSSTMPSRTAPMAGRDLYGMVRCEGSAGPRAVDHRQRGRRFPCQSARLSADPASRNDVDLGAIDQGRKLFEQLDGAPTRRVIDISGDGPTTMAGT